MRAFVMGVILFLDTILQSTYLEFIRIFGIKPNTTLIIIVSFAIMRGSFEGAIIGFVGGLTYDIFYGQNLGFNALLGMYVGYLCGKVNEDFYTENYFLEFILCLISVFACEFLTYVFNFLIRGKTNFMFYFSTTILPCAIYTAILSIFLYKLFFFINTIIEQYEKRV